jgi:hypothetical protein
VCDVLNPLFKLYRSSTIALHGLASVCFNLHDVRKGVCFLIAARFTFATPAFAWQEDAHVRIIDIEINWLIKKERISTFTH